MNEKVQKVLDIWHNHFEDENLHYSEFESSDIEYFVSCLLYNNFQFSKALPTMQTIDLSYDFLSSCSDEYDEIQMLIKSINLDSEMQKIEFLENFLEESKSKYTRDECYLLNRISLHLSGIRERHEKDIKPVQVDFQRPAKKSSNPLDRI